MNQKYAFITATALIAVVGLIAAPFLASSSNLLQTAVADWPKSVRYSSETLGGTSIGCESPEECKEGTGTASPNQAAKSSCEERTGQKCKKDK
jgi:hypothetical protein